MKINFHILEETSGQKSLFYACSLIEKAHAEKQRVYIHANSREEAERIDALLWTYRDDSFVPHNLYSATDDCPPPVQIGFGEAPQHHDDIMINLTPAIPEFYKQFGQVIEIVFADANVQQVARERFKQYREQGCEMNTLKIKANDT